MAKAAEKQLGTVTRRQFVLMSVAAGGGMAVGLAPRTSDAAGNVVEDAVGAEVSPWLTIDGDGIVTVRVATPDIGNGVLTQAAMTIAEELPFDWSKIRTEYASTNRDYRDHGVYSQVAGRQLSYFSGRSTNADRLKVYLQVAASARERLKAAAAANWKIPVAEIEAENGILTHRPTGRTLPYGAVAARAATMVLEPEPTPKPPEAWTLLGKVAVKKITAPAIVTGKLVYGIDVRLPDMVYAALLQAPVRGGRLKSYDAAPILKRPGVRAVVVVDPDAPRGAPPTDMPFPYKNTLPQSGIAVIADRYWQAKTALEAMQIEWDDGAGAHWKSTQDVYDATRASLDKPPAKVVKEVGDTMGRLNSGARIVEASYLTPYCDHAVMEPLNGTALVTPDRVDVWHPSQQTLNGSYVAAHETGLPLDKVYVHQTMIGGAYGRRVDGDDLRMVVAVAKKYPGKPVHVIWSREETTRQGRYRAMIAAKFRASLGADGLPDALFVHASGKDFPLMGLIDCSYASGVIPNLHVQTSEVPLHILTSSYRGPGYNSFAFMVDSFIDECAHAAGADPLDYRIRLHEKWPDPGYQLCLREVAAKANWGQKLPRGTAQGVSVANWGGFGKPQAGTTVAAVATVEVSDKGVITVQRIDMAFDCGRTINRLAVEAQIQGGIVFGLNMSLNEELDIENGRIVQGNFDSYPILRMGGVPKEIHIHYGGLSNHDRYAELGEPPVGVIGPAIANAVFKATGQRLRQMPFRKSAIAA